jgi:histidyl-tRNA synthetase
MGLERLLMIMEEHNTPFPAPPQCEVYFAPMGNEAATRCFAIAAKLREGGVAAQTDIVGRGLKAQMKYADKIKAKYTVVLGDDEVANKTAVAKNMLTKEQITLDLTKSIREQLK